MATGLRARPWPYPAGQLNRGRRTFLAASGLSRLRTRRRISRRRPYLSGPGPASWRPGGRVSPRSDWLQCRRASMAGSSSGRSALNPASMGWYSDQRTTPWTRSSGRTCVGPLGRARVLLDSGRPDPSRPTPTPGPAEGRPELGGDIHRRCAADRPMTRRTWQPGSWWVCRKASALWRPTRGVAMGAGGPFSAVLEAHVPLQRAEGTLGSLVHDQRR